MHKVEPKGATFVFSGYGYREGMIRSEIERLGASTTRHVDSATTYLVSKDDTTVEHLDARVRKIPILSDEDLQRLLAGEEVEIEEADALTEKLAKTHPHLTIS
jgi:BRCT domain type II-containing protein